MRKTSFPPKIAVFSYAPKDAAYHSAEALFPSGDIALAGTLVMPDKQEKLPAVLLVTGKSPYARENAGLYTDISDILARNGFITLRYDGRGMGKSQGDISSVSLTDEMRDAENALKFLSNHKKVDNERLFIMAHGEACSYLAQLDLSKYPVRGFIMLSATKPAIWINLECDYVSNKIKEMSEEDAEYGMTLKLLNEGALNLIKDTKKEHIFVKRKRVFTRRMAQLRDFKPIDGFKKLDTPSLLVYGKKDRFVSPRYIDDIKNALAGAEGRKAEIVYFRRLGHFLGTLTDKDDTVLHYTIDPEVMETIIGWLRARAPLQI